MTENVGVMEMEIKPIQKKSFEKKFWNENGLV